MSFDEFLHPFKYATIHIQSISFKSSHLQAQSYSYWTFVMYLISIQSVLMTSLSFVILVICVFSFFFFLVSLSRDVYQLIDLFKVCLLVSLIFLFYFQVCNIIAFCFLNYYYFLLLTLGLSSSSLSSFLKWGLRLLILYLPIF